MPATLGRPTKYKPEYCETVVGFGKDGMSLAEMALELEVDISTFNLWREKHEAFSAAVKKAVGFSQGWWEKQGRLSAVGQVDNFNATSYIFNMKNRFKEDWRDKHEVDNTSSDGSMKMPTRIELVSPNDNSEG